MIRIFLCIFKEILCIIRYGMRAVAIHQRNLNLIIFHSYDPIDIQKGGAEFIGYKILSNPSLNICPSVQHLSMQN